MKLELSFDDGHVLDVKVAAMLKRHGLRGMFYIPGSKEAPGYHGEGGMSDDDLIEIAKDHDIGFHTYSHPHDIKTLDDKTVVDEVVRGRTKLEVLVGQTITSFCYARGKYDTRVVEAVQSSGYLEARTVDIGAISTAYDPYRKPTTVHVYPRHEEYGDLPWWKYAEVKLLEASKREDGYFHLWGHSWEIEKFDHWCELDHVLTLIEKLKPTL